MNYNTHDSLLITQRMLPTNLEAEQALLGAILANRRAFEMVADFLQPEHFADPVHSKIFAAMARRISNNETADVITLKREFENSGGLDDVGGVAYLAQLLSAMVGIISAPDYGRAVHDAWMRRQLIDVCSQTVEQCFSPEGLLAQDILEGLDAGLTRIADGAGETKPLIHAGEAVQRAVALSMQAAERVSGLAGVTTGYKAMDRMLGGLMPGQLYIGGARPAMGKTGLALGIAARAASNGLHVAFWSGEMGAEQMGARLAAAHAGMDVMSVFRGKNYVLPEDHLPGQHGDMQPLSAAQWDRLITAQRDAGRLGLQFDDRAGVTVAALRTRARRLKRAKKLDLLVVDYVGLMRSSPLTEKQKLYERMTEISSDLAKLARELEIPILVMAQLNRDVEKRENKMPQLADLRDSGGLEQDAYCVFFIHRPHYYLMAAGEPLCGPKETAETFADRSSAYFLQLEQTRGLAMINIAKHRNGPTGICRLRFAADTIWFRDESEGDNSGAWGTPLMGVM